MTKTATKRRSVEFTEARILNVAYPKTEDPEVAYVLFWADGAEHEGVVFRGSDREAFEAVSKAGRGDVVRIRGVEQSKPEVFRRPGGTEVQVIIRELNARTSAP